MIPRKWLKKENIFAAVGLGMIIVEFMHVEFFNGVFHYEFLLAASGLCGITVAQKGDKT